MFLVIFGCSTLLNTNPELRIENIVINITNIISLFFVFMVIIIFT